MMTFVNVTIDQWEHSSSSQPRNVRECSLMQPAPSAPHTAAMNVFYLATSYKTDAPWWVVVMLAVLTVGTFVAIAWGLYMTFIGSRETKIRGQALSGTAEVLEVKTRGAVGDPMQGGQRAICRILLSVQIPGREPYEATARQNFPPRVLDTIHVGRIVAVQVDANDPQRVRIDVSRPATPEGVFNMPPVVNVTKSSWSPESGWSGSPPPEGIPDQLTAALGDVFQQSAGSAPVISAADLLATGQRVPAALKSFAPTGTTPRSLGRTPSRPELIDAPHYMLEVELHFPNLAPITARAVQSVPVHQVPNLAIGRQLTCAVDSADPSHRFVVDWGI